MTVPAPLLLTPEGAATVLRIGRTRLYQLLATGDLLSIELGGGRRIAIGVVAEGVDLKTARPGSATPIPGSRWRSASKPRLRATAGPPNRSPSA